VFNVVPTSRELFSVLSKLLLLCCYMVTQSSEGEACHGRLLLEVDDGSVLTVVGQNGDPDLQLICVQLHRAELHHNGAFILFLSCS